MTRPTRVLRRTVLMAVVLMGLLPVTVVAVQAPVRPALATLPAGRVVISSGGVTRAYYVHVPRTGSGPRSLVLALHGRYQTPETIMRYSGLDAFSDSRGFVLVYPGAVGGGWNAGTCCAGGVQRQLDDVGFLDDVITDVAARTSIDLRRVLVLGFSNGGMLAYRYGCQRSGRVAGIGVVAGTMTADRSFARPAPPACRPTEPVPLVHVHGLGDRTVDPAGGYQRSLGSASTATRTSVAAYAAAAGCTGSGLTKVGAVAKRTFGGCRTRTGRGVQSVTLDGVGHAWTRTGKGYDTTAGLLDQLAGNLSRLPAGR